MFFLLEMERIVTLPPVYFGSGLRETLRKQLIKEVEGTCSGKHGYIVCVTQVKESGEVRWMTRCLHICMRETIA